MGNVEETTMSPLKCHEELDRRGIDHCRECHCATGTDWKYEDFSNKTQSRCTQCGTLVYLEEHPMILERNY